MKKQVEDAKLPNISKKEETNPTLAATIQKNQKNKEE